MERTTKAHFHIEPIYRLSKLCQQERKLQREIDKYFEDIIKNEVLPARRLNDDNNNNDTKQMKLIDFLLDDKNEFSDEDIRDHFKATVYGVS
jgi:cytochrome P450